MPFTFAGASAVTAIQDTAGNVLPATDIEVWRDAALTQPATLYRDRVKTPFAGNVVGSPPANPGETGIDASANFQFWADPGVYYIHAVGQPATKKFLIVIDVDPTEADSETAAAQTTANAATVTANAAQASMTAHLSDAIDAHDASAVSFNPGAGPLASVNVQDALQEVATQPPSEPQLAGHLADGLDAHDAAAVSVVPFATIAAMNVQDALEELLADGIPGVQGEQGEVGPEGPQGPDGMNAPPAILDTFNRPPVPPRGAGLGATDTGEPWVSRIPNGPYQHWGIDNAGRAEPITATALDVGLTPTLQSIDVGVRFEFSVEASILPSAVRSVIGLSIDDGGARFGRITCWVRTDTGSPVQKLILEILTSFAPEDQFALETVIGVPGDQGLLRVYVLADAVTAEWNGTEVLRQGLNASQAAAVHAMQSAGPIAYSDFTGPVGDDGASRLDNFQVNSIFSLVGLSDVNFDSQPTNGQALVFDEPTGTWHAESITIDALSYEGPMSVAGADDPGSDPAYAHGDHSHPIPGIGTVFTFDEQQNPTVVVTEDPRDGGYWADVTIDRDGSVSPNNAFLSGDIAFGLRLRAGDEAMVPLATFAPQNPEFPCIGFNTDSLEFAEADGGMSPAGNYMRPTGLFEYHDRSPLESDHASPAHRVGIHAGFLFFSGLTNDFDSGPPLHTPRYEYVRTINNPYYNPGEDDSLPIVSANVHRCYGQRGDGFRVVHRHCPDDTADFYVAARWDYQGVLDLANAGGLEDAPGPNNRRVAVAKLDSWPEHSTYGDRILLATNSAAATERWGIGITDEDETPILEPAGKSGAAPRRIVFFMGNESSTATSVRFKRANTTLEESAAYGGETLVDLGDTCGGVGGIIGMAPVSVPPVGASLGMGCLFVTPLGGLSYKSPAGVITPVVP
jgi:hypothetical protein